ncbi:MAG: DUF4296 domain-containing protein [Saprospiraceae bacterium]
MKVFTYILLFVLCTIACNQAADLRIEEEKLVQVLTDVHIAEGAAQNLVQPVKDSMLTLYYQQIFDIHKLEEADFKADMIYLSNHSKVSQDIYERVLNEITKREAAEK